MSRIDENGFLEGSICNWIADNGARHATVFAAIRELNRECHRFLSRRAVGTKSELQTTTSVLFTRMMEMFQGLFIAVEHGMTSLSRVVFRVFLEAYFILKAIHKDPSFRKQYLDQLHVVRRKLVNSMHNSRSPILEELRGGMDKNLAKEIQQTIEDQDINPLTAEEAARRAGLEEVYATAYRLLSGAVHTMGWDLESHLVYDETEKAIKGFKYGPSDSDTEKHLGLAGMCMADALEIISSIFGEDKAQLCGRFTGQFQAALDKKSP